MTVKTRYVLCIPRSKLPHERVATFLGGEEEKAKAAWHVLDRQRAYLVKETYEVIADHRKDDPFSRKHLTRK